MIFMEVEILNDDKQELKVKIGNLTLAELLREYLNQDAGVRFAAWRREHPTEAPILNIKTQGKTAKKALQDAIAKIDKDAIRILNEFKKAK